MADDILVRDGNGDLAVNTVTSTEANVPYNYDDCFTIDTNGRRALRVVGSGGGGDQHNLGYYATQAALEEAYPTAEAGDWAIVGATDTVWIWDTDNEEWVDSDQKGQVTSVNGQTGDVTLTIPAAQVNSDWNANSGVAQILNKPTIPDAIQVSAMPTASATEENKIYQFTGTTDANYTNGYFYKCVSDGQTPATYSWTRVDVQPTPSGLPDQTGQSGKFLTTDGTDASWATINALTNNATKTDGLVVISTDYTTTCVESNVRATILGSGGTLDGLKIKAGQDCVAIGSGAQATVDNSIAIGRQAHATGSSTIAIGNGATTNGGIAIGRNAQGGIENIQLGNGTNPDRNTFKVGNANGNFEIMSADGTIPAARHASLPSADGTYVLKLVISGGVPTLSWVAE